MSKVYRLIPALQFGMAPLIALVKLSLKLAHNPNRHFSEAVLDLTGEEEIKTKCVAANRPGYC
jgi:hypothetical protein